MHSATGKEMANASSLKMIDYNNNSEVQALAARKLSEILKKYTAELSENLPSDETVQICEYGCATGGSSIAPIKAIQEKTGKRNLKILMNDLPMNDWETLKNTVEKEFPDIDFRYTAKTMYSAIAENCSIHLGYSCFAQHWLDNGAPQGLPGDALWANQLHKDCPERQSWENASRDNWEKKLLMRAKEIVSGGMLVIHIQSSKICGNLSENFAVTLQKAKSSMIKNKEIDLEEANAMYIPQYCKSPAEIFNTLCTPKISSLWQLEEAHYEQLPCDILFDQKNINKQIKFLQGFMNSTLACSMTETQLAKFWGHVTRIAQSDVEALTSNGMSTFICLKRL